MALSVNTDMADLGRAKFCKDSFGYKNHLVKKFCIQTMTRHAALSAILIDFASFLDQAFTLQNPDCILDRVIVFSDTPPKGPHPTHG
jgi:hypothetical protein